MRGLVVYESMYGNTQQVAQAVAAGARQHMEVDLCEVSGAPHSLEGYDLVLVGGPTHAHGMSTPESRASAVDRGGHRVSEGEGMREWIASLTPRPDAVIGCFDTRIRGPRLLWGSAAHAARRALLDRGFEVELEPVSFLVSMQDPEHTDAGHLLLDGELAHAETWGEDAAHWLGEMGHLPNEA